MLSGREFAIINIPVDVFSIVKVESICPVKSSTDLIDILFDDKIKSTSRVVVTLIEPPAAIFVDVPTISLGLKPLKSK